ncbi:hypothetical protein VD0002_g4307 [Verticillium dahliae]|uniref:Oligoribonuclease n=2 Tax=Verticillium dahliae TaxID=27337 RepID=G2WZ85_VERDV|nr:oligoribonuclease [Verticillium dahliae VdLs.17]KAF3344721.1 Xylosidase/arabinosidase [Verticillium dahliae VDG2]KAH6703725.1 oligoribonuclease [Verticillium dahliae]EGY21887.1 oligoribonuclease [Verticillium dahliae VdLs.17]PNH28970.1 hypothetical protein BJF96_g7743 [Verticillium dahliae]PNH41780.1 hypothetical protein VD0004_g5417 [Verticillium dahliae]
MDYLRYRATPSKAVPQQAASDGPLVWIDCEMTGLDPDTEEILEIHCIITTGNLEPLDGSGWGVVVHQPASRLDQMGEWCTDMHAKTGLTGAVLASTTTPQQAAEGLLAHIRKYVPTPKVGLLAGNTVHADRGFLAKQPYTPIVEHLHHRIVDVSSLKEAAKRWCPREIVEGAPVKTGTHRGREDIEESIAEARYYREVIFGATWSQGREALAAEPTSDDEQWANNLM